jgi:hypothetical protein
MPKAKNKLHSKPKKGFFRPIHLQVVIALVVYYTLSNIVLISSVVQQNVYISFFVPFIFGLTSTFVFLYLFSHEDFFHFMGNFEKEEKGKEKGYLNKLIRYGRILACILVAIIGGPIFSALTIRFLFTKSENRYIIAFISILISTAFVVAIAKGLFNFIFPM